MRTFALLLTLVLPVSADPNTSPFTWSDGARFEARFTGEQEQHLHDGSTTRAEGSFTFTTTHRAVDGGHEVVIDDIALVPSPKPAPQMLRETAAIFQAAGALRVDPVGHFVGVDATASADAMSRRPALLGFEVSPDTARAFWASIWTSWYETPKVTVARGPGTWTVPTWNVLATGRVPAQSTTTLEQPVACPVGGGQCARITTTSINDPEASVSALQEAFDQTHPGTRVLRHFQHSSSEMFVTLDHLHPVVYRYEDRVESTVEVSGQAATSQQRTSSEITWTPAAPQP